jgi:hypothetical protein
MTMMSLKALNNWIYVVLLLYTANRKSPKNLNYITGYISTDVMRPECSRK